MTEAADAHTPTEVRLTSPERVLFPDRITKQDLFEYYGDVCTA